MATQKGRNWSSGDIVTAANLSSVERGVSAVSSLYEPTTWANGDTVTAAALNNIEQGIVNADGGGKTWVTLCEEEVTTEEDNGMYGAQLAYSQLISADTIRVTFDGTEYMCDVNNTQEFYGYGGFSQTGPDFSEYPFIVVSGMSGSPPNVGVVNQIITETSGTYTVKIEALQESGSSDFSTAQVTVTTSNPQTIFMPYIHDDEEESAITAFVLGGGEYTAVLYKGVCIAFAINFEDAMVTPTINVTGNATISGRQIFITGDCTITISDSGDTPIST